MGINAQTFERRKHFKVMVGQPMYIESWLNELNEENFIEIIQMDISDGMITMVLTVEPRDPNWPK